MNVSSQIAAEDAGESDALTILAAFYMKAEKLFSDPTLAVRDSDATTTTPDKKSTGGGGGSSSQASSPGAMSAQSSPRKAHAEPVFAAPFRRALIGNSNSQNSAAANSNSSHSVSKSLHLPTYADIDPQGRFKEAFLDHATALLFTLFEAEAHNNSGRMSSTSANPPLEGDTTPQLPPPHSGGNLSSAPSFSWGPSVAERHRRFSLWAPPPSSSAMQSPGSASLVSRTSPRQQPGGSFYLPRNAFAASTSTPRDKLQHNYYYGSGALKSDAGGSSAPQSSANLRRGGGRTRTVSIIPSEDSLIQGLLLSASSSNDRAAQSNSSRPGAVAIGGGGGGGSTALHRQSPMMHSAASSLWGSVITPQEAQKMACFQSLPQTVHMATFLKTIGGDSADELTLLSGVGDAAPTTRHSGGLNGTQRPSDQKSSQADNDSSRAVHFENGEEDAERPSAVTFTATRTVRHDFSHARPSHVVLNGRYEFIARIGEGGQGSVWEVHDLCVAADANELKRIAKESVCSAASAATAPPKPSADDDGDGSGAADAATSVSRLAIKIVQRRKAPTRQRSGSLANGGSSIRSALAAYGDGDVGQTLKRGGSDNDDGHQQHERMESAAISGGSEFKSPSALSPRDPTQHREVRTSPIAGELANRRVVGGANQIRRQLARTTTQEGASSVSNRPSSATDTTAARTAPILRAHTLEPTAISPTEQTVASFNVANDDDRGRASIYEIDPENRSQQQQEGEDGQLPAAKRETLAHTASGADLEPIADESISKHPNKASVAFSSSVLGDTPKPEQDDAADDGDDESALAHLGARRLQRMSLRHNAEILRQFYLSGDDGSGSMATTEGSGGNNNAAAPHAPHAVASELPENLAVEILCGLSRHPNIMPLLEVVDDPLCNNVFLVMPLAEPFPCQIAPGAGPFATRALASPSEALRRVLEAAAALQLLHATGVVHCDVKLDNFLLLDGRLVLCDFGICQVGSSIGVLGGGDGTLAYWAPECHAPSSGDSSNSALKLSGATDCYALGLCAYTMLFGRFPYWPKGGNATNPLQWAMAVPGSPLYSGGEGGDRVVLPPPQQSASSTTAVTSSSSSTQRDEAHLRQIITGLLEPCASDRWTAERILRSEPPAAAIDQ